MRLHASIILAGVVGGLALSSCWNSPEIPRVDENGNPLFDTNPPIVKLKNPLDGTGVSGTVIVSADATDDAGIEYVEFYVDNIRLQNGRITSAPYYYSWDTGGLTLGSVHKIFAKAADTSDNIGYSDTISVTISTGGGSTDSIPPVVAVTNPSNGATVGGMVIITADATDNVAVYKVEFFIDGVQPANGTEYSSPYQHAWDTTTLPNGSSHTIVAKATDTSSNFSYSDTVTVTVNSGGGGDVTPPTVSIVYPSEGDVVSGSITILADATDDVGIRFVEFFLDGTKMVDGIEYNVPYEQIWDTTVHPDGSSHYLVASATDSSGNVAFSDTVHVTVNNGTAQKPLATDANVIVLVIDGARYTETFGDSTHKNVKFMWNYLVPQGALFTNFRNEGVTSTNPGHSSIATSTWQNVANDGTERPDKPTFFEYLRKEYIVAKSETYSVMGKAKLSICSYSTYPGYGANYGSTVDAADRDDATTYQALINHLQTDRPRLTFVNFPTVDKTAHSTTKGWNDYINAVQVADSLVYELWQFLQADAFYAGKTYLFVTNDHGRHTDNYKSHGDGCEGCRHIMCLALGPNVKQGYTVSTTYTQIDICPTVSAIFSFSSPMATGNLMNEIFSTPIQSPVPVHSIR